MSQELSPHELDSIQDFVAASEDGQVTDQELVAFEELLRENIAARRAYAEYVEQAVYLPRVLASLRSQASAGRLPLDGIVEEEWNRTAPNQSRPSAFAARGFLRGLRQFEHETPTASALTWLVMAILCSGMVLTIFFCIMLVFRGVGVTVHVDAPQMAKSLPPSSIGREAGQDTAASNGKSTAEQLISRPSATIARLVQTCDCHWAIGSHSPRLGDDLAPGRKLVLLSGLAEVMFQSGVRALLEGPATMEVVSSHSTRLFQGKVTVRVEDPDAIGFQVHTPGMKYTDLGTEFGVSVAKDGTTETMVVFRGQVRAELAQDSAKADSTSGSSQLPLPLVLMANEAVRVASADKNGAKQIERIAADVAQFVRKMPAPEPFPLFGTGIGLDRGQPDPHWEITAVSTNPEFVPRLATVAVPSPTYPLDSLGTARWISLTKELKAMPVGCRLTFRTQFDLSGFDPATARIDGLAIADNWVAEVRLNGKTVARPDGKNLARPPGNKGLITSSELHIESAQLPGIWQAGRNTLEIVIENGAALGSIEDNPMALYIRCKGVAMRLKE